MKKIIPILLVLNARQVLSCSFDQAAANSWQISGRQSQRFSEEYTRLILETADEFYIELGICNSDSFYDESCLSQIMPHHFIVIKKGCIPRDVQIQKFYILRG